jgi:hypothetical protein
MVQDDGMGRVGHANALRAAWLPFIPMAKARGLLAGYR